MLDNITIKSFNGIGDALFMTPTLSRIKEKYPDAKITINTNYPDLFKDNPHVDKIGNKNEGVFLGYPDPIHGKNPTTHHIMSDWRIICDHFGLRTKAPRLSPELYMTLDSAKTDLIGVQAIHKGHWHQKKVWPFFESLITVESLITSGLEEIPKTNGVVELINKIASYKAVVCAEGGISHIAKALGIPAIVIYGGFADPKWNGYKDQINVVRTLECSHCYNSAPCKQEKERLCMRMISVDYINYLIEGLSPIKELTIPGRVRHIESRALEYCKGKGIDVGAGPYCLRGARPVYKGEDEHAHNIKESGESLDYVFSSHCLEHLDDPLGALIEWNRVLKPKGVVFLYLPSPNYLPWRANAMRDHKQDLYEEDLKFWLDLSGFDVVFYDPDDGHFSQTIIGVKR